MPTPSKAIQEQLRIDRELFYEFVSRYASGVLEDNSAPNATDIYVPFIIIRSLSLGCTVISKQ